MACEDRNKYQPPPVPEVGVEKPQRRPVTLYLELTGNATAFNKVDLVARVQGFLDKVVKFGRVFQIYAQAEAAARIQPESLRTLSVRNTSGGMVPLGTLAEISNVSGPSLISLYNLYPAATVIANTARGFSSGQGLQLLEQIARETLPPTSGYEWTAMSYQEKEIGNQIYIVYALSLLLVYLVLAGQYESWMRP
jgi:HAE1 family hydrophobic/amphiphilic exporter-1